MGHFGVSSGNEPPSFEPQLQCPTPYAFSQRFPTRSEFGIDRSRLPNIGPDMNKNDILRESVVLNVA